MKARSKTPGKIQDSTTAGISSLVSTYILIFGHVPVDQLWSTFMGLNGSQILSLGVAIASAIWQVYRDEEIAPVINIVKKK